jgi:hypothetical protein
METTQTSDSDRFPYTLSSGPHEPLPLQKLRDRSHYLTFGGIYSLVVALVSFTAGVLGNLIILSPILLLSGVLLGWLYPYLRAYPFQFVAAGFLLYLIPCCVFLLRRKTFNEFWNRSVALLVCPSVLLTLLAVSPFLIETIRSNTFFRENTLQEFGGALVFVSSIVGSMAVQLRTVPTLRTTIISVAVAVLTFLVIWGTVLYIANFMFFGAPPHGLQLLLISLAVLIACFALSLFVFLQRQLHWLTKLGITISILVILVVSSAAVLPLQWHLREQSSLSSEALGQVNRRLARVIDGLHAGEKWLPDHVRDSVQEMANRKSALDQHARIGDEDEYWLLTTTLSDYIDRWTDSKRSLVPLPPEYYHSAVLLLTDAETLDEVYARDRYAMLDALTNSGSERLLSISTGAARSLSEMDLKRHCRSKIVEVVVERFVQGSIPPLNPHDYSPLAEPTFEKLVETNLPLDRLVRDINGIRVPQSRGHQLFFFTGRSEEAEQGRTGTDLSLSGPLLFGPAALPDEIHEIRNKLAIRRMISNFSPIEVQKWTAEHAAVLSKYSTEPSALIAEARASKTPFLLLVSDALGNDFNMDVEGIINACRLAVKDPPGRANNDVNVQRPSASDLDDTALFARRELTRIALTTNHPQRSLATHVLGEIYKPELPFSHELRGKDDDANEAKYWAIYRRPEGSDFSLDEVTTLLARRFDDPQAKNADALIRRLAHGQYGDLKGLGALNQQVFSYSRWPKTLLLVILAILIVVLCLVLLKPNSTSLHRYYRDRIGQSFLPSVPDAKTPECYVAPKLSELDPTHSESPYHLINAVVNLRSPLWGEPRGHKADFFIFSPLHVGSERTEYVSTASFETTDPDFTIASAMAISAGAVSPSMGRFTNGLMTMFLTIANARLGYWIPNPKAILKQRSVAEGASTPDDTSFRRAFAQELEVIENRRAFIASRRGATFARPSAVARRKLTASNELIGLALSGGGIRAASIALGVAQVAHECKLLPLVDYLSTVSGGGYLGTSLTVYMQPSPSRRQTENAAPIGVANPTVAEQAPAQRPALQGVNEASFYQWRRYQSWLPRFWLLYWEMVGALDSTGSWLNVSDGGHIENLGVFELLRRRARIVVACDAEADPVGFFDGLSTLSRLAELELGTRIDFPKGALDRLVPVRAGGSSTRHFAVGLIRYPADSELQLEAEEGYLIYLKTSLVGGEDQILRALRRKNPIFPHDPTTNQNFGEEQFEAYRRLGEKIARSAFGELMGPEVRNEEGNIIYSKLVEKLSSKVTEPAP